MTAFAISRKRRNRVLLLAAAAFLLAALPVWPAYVIGVTLGLAVWLTMSARNGTLTSIWRRSKALWPLLLLLTIFFFFPYSNIDPSVRHDQNYFSLYRRYGGLFSLWDAIILLTFMASAVPQLIQGRLRFSLGRRELLGVVIFFAIAFVFGMAHVQGTPLEYGTTELKRPFIALLPICYFLVIHLLVLNYADDSTKARTLLRWLVWLTVALVLYGIGRLILIYQGRLATMWPFGLPIVLYDQMMMLYPLLFAMPVYWLCLQTAPARRTTVFHWLLWLTMAALILCSARRFNYLLLGGGIVLVVGAGFFMRWYSIGTVVRSAIRVVLVTVLLALAVAAVYRPAVAKVSLALQSIDMSSRLGFRHGGNIRLAELQNLWANLEQRPYAFVVGMGLGTKWQELREQPLDSFTYPKAYVASSRGWYPQFHLPYVASLYRFGILGCALLLTGVGWYAYRQLRWLRHNPFAWTKSLGVAMVVFIVLTVPNLGDSLNPTAAILSGFCTGLLERLR